MAFNGKLLDGMVIFAEVIKAGSFTKAADSSGHSTSYISKEINKLEERLGIRLMHRTTRTISLTPEGKLYYEQCQQIINDAQQAEFALSGRQLEPQGELKVSCPVSFGLSRLRPILSKFLEQYPQVTLNIDLNDRKVDVVGDGFDVVIRASMHLEDSSLICRRFMTSKAITVASPEYLEKFGKPNHPRELEQHKTLAYSNLKSPNSWIYMDCKGNEIIANVNSHVLTNSPELELELCTQGLGIMRMPVFNLGDEVETGKLVPLFEDCVEPEINVYLVYASRKHMSAKVRVFIDFVMSELGTI